MATILISGQWLWPQYQEASAKALERLGHTVVRFGWHQYFFAASESHDPSFRSFIAQRQNKYILGPLIRTINRGLLSLAEETKPDIVWLYNDTHIVPKTVLALRDFLARPVLAQYANDNPWGANQSRIMWRHFKKSVPYFDINFCYRSSNEGDLARAGAKKTALLRSSYIPEESLPLKRETIEERFKSDVVFVGHYENDGRLDLVTSVAELGCNLKLFGTGWNIPLDRLPQGHPMKKLAPVKPARAEEYRKAICGARIALSFLSKLNEDTYTRRNFEIPAMKSFMLSEYSDDLANLFAEGTEAEYFRSKAELLSKVRYYLDHEHAIAQIAAGGHERVKKDGHDVVSRMKQFMQHIDQVRR